MKQHTFTCATPSELVLHKRFVLDNTTGVRLREILAVTAFDASTTAFEYICHKSSGWVVRLSGYAAIRKNIGTGTVETALVERNSPNPSHELVQAVPKSKLGRHWSE